MVVKNKTKAKDLVKQTGVVYMYLWWMYRKVDWLQSQVACFCISAIDGFSFLEDLIYVLCMDERPWLYFCVCCLFIQILQRVCISLVYEVNVWALFLNRSHKICYHISRQELLPWNACHTGYGWLVGAFVTPPPPHCLPLPYGTPPTHTPFSKCYDSSV